MKILTVKQPWAYLICSGLKDIENRSWPTKFRGRILIHASAKSAKNPHEILTMPQFMEISNHKKEIEFMQSYRNTSQIIGSVEVIDCVKNHPSLWAEKGVYNWVLANPVLFDKLITNIKGKLLLWNYNK